MSQQILSFIKLRGAALAPDLPCVAPPSGASAPGCAAGLPVLPGSRGPICRGARPPIPAKGCCPWGRVKALPILQPPFPASHAWGACTILSSLVQFRWPQSTMEWLRGDRAVGHSRCPGGVAAGIGRCLPYHLLSLSLPLPQADFSSLCCFSWWMWNKGTNWPPLPLGLLTPAWPAFHHGDHSRSLLLPGWCDTGCSSHVLVLQRGPAPTGH